MDSKFVETRAHLCGKKLPRKRDGGGIVLTVTRQIEHGHLEPGPRHRLDLLPVEADAPRDAGELHHGRTRSDHGVDLHGHRIERTRAQGNHSRSAANNPPTTV